MVDGLYGAPGELALFLVTQAPKSESDTATILCHPMEEAAARERAVKLQLVKRHHVVARLLLTVGSGIAPSTFGPALPRAILGTKKSVPLLANIAKTLARQLLTVGAGTAPDMFGPALPQAILGTKKNVPPLATIAQKNDSEME